MFLKNIISIILPCMLAAVISLLLNCVTSLVSENAYYGLLFFAVLCFILNIMYAVNAGSKALTELLMAGIVIKLLLVFTVIVVYSVTDHAGLFNFSMHFIIYYVLFTAFEIRYLLRLIKTSSTPQ